MYNPNTAGGLGDLEALRQQAAEYAVSARGSVTETQTPGAMAEKPPETPRKEVRKSPEQHDATLHYLNYVGRQLNVLRKTPTVTRDDFTLAA